MTITVYENAKFGGEKRIFTADVADLEDFDNRISSLIVKGGAWQVFKRKNFQRYVDTFEEGYHEWVANDLISSIKRVVPSEGFDEPHLILYEDSNFGGRSLDVFESTPHLSWYDFAGKASSYKVVRGAWKLFDEADYRGAHRVCGADVAGCYSSFIGRDWNDVVVSARPIRGGSEDDADQPIVLEKVTIDWRQISMTTKETCLATFNDENESETKYKKASWGNTFEVPTVVTHTFTLDSPSVSPGMRFTLPAPKTTTTTTTTTTSLDPFPTFGSTDEGTLVSVSDEFRRQLGASFVVSSNAPSRARRHATTTTTVALPSRLPPGAKSTLSVKLATGEATAPAAFKFRRGGVVWRETGEWRGVDGSTVNLRVAQWE